MLLKDLQIAVSYESFCRLKLGRNHCMKLVLTTVMRVLLITIIKYDASGPRLGENYAFFTRPRVDSMRVGSAQSASLTKGWWVVVSTAWLHWLVACR